MQYFFKPYSTFPARIYQSRMLASMTHLRGLHGGLCNTGQKRGIAVVMAATDDNGGSGRDI